jgi:hypothetical protein
VYKMCDDHDGTMSLLMRMTREKVVYCAYLSTNVI